MLQTLTQNSKKARGCKSPFVIALIFIILLTLAVQHNPVNASPKQPQTHVQEPSVSTCFSAFPVGQRTIFLPLTINQRGNDRAQVEDADPPLDKQAGRLAPIGDELGDVGQYYSQVAPSLDSRITIHNQNDTTATYTLALFGDTGYKARTLESCQIDGDAIQTITTEAGQLTLTQADEALDMETICARVIVHNHANNAPVEPALHGLYQARISTNDDANLDIRVESATDANHPQIIHAAAATYSAIEAGSATAIVNLPGVVATRDPNNWWDTEIIVQNVTDHPVDLKFRFYGAHGESFQNNHAQLAGQERRIFLASQLLYANDLNANEAHNPGNQAEGAEPHGDGFLYARRGWHAATIIALPAEDVEHPARVAVMTNIFKQPVDKESNQPRAQFGSDCMVSTGQSHISTHLTYLRPDGAPRLLRIYNATATANAVTITMQNMHSPGTRQVQRQLSPHEVWSLRDDQLAALPMETVEPGTIPGTLPGTVPGVAELSLLQITSSEPVGVLMWDGETMAKPLESHHETNVWYAPLVGAPVVPFHWDDDAASDPARAGHPGSGYGIAETGSYRARPDWARAMNWYKWRTRRANCNQPVSTIQPYSTYIPIVTGLGSCGERRGRGCTNSDERLAQVRNDIPSSCTGRPLFLINEPDLYSQSFMTYPELGRAVYVVRQWPGELYSPAFASQFYDRPTYPEETNPWCKVPENLATCPNSPNCDRCTRDGILDGETDPIDISFAGLEAYFGTVGRWAQGQAWAFDDIVNGMLVHVYLPAETFTPEALGDGPHWRAEMLRQFHDRAIEAGWPIIVKEYGFVTWPDVDGSRPTFDAPTLATRVDDMRRLLQKNLSNDNTADEDSGLKKLFWFHTGCNNPNLQLYESLCLFQANDSSQLTAPMGACWHEDAVTQADEDTVCGVARRYLPIIKR